MTRRRRRRRPYPLLWRTRALDGRDRLGGRKRMGAPPVHNIQPPESHWRATKHPPESQQATKKSPKSHERATRANSGTPVRKIQTRLTQLQFSQVVLPAELASSIQLTCKVEENLSKVKISVKIEKSVVAVRNSGHLCSCGNQSKK